MKTNILTSSEQPNHWARAQTPQLSLLLLVELTVSTNVSQLNVGAAVACQSSSLLALLTIFERIANLKKMPCVISSHVSRALERRIPKSKCELYMTFEIFALFFDIIHEIKILECMLYRMNNQLYIIGGYSTGFTPNTENEGKIYGKYQMISRSSVCLNDIPSTGYIDNPFKRKLNMPYYILYTGGFICTLLMQLLLATVCTKPIALEGFHQSEPNFIISNEYSQRLEADFYQELRLILSECAEHSLHGNGNGSGSSRSLVCGA